MDAWSEPVSTAQVQVAEGLGGTELNVACSGPCGDSRAEVPIKNLGACTLSLSAT
jgi:hypothetical protein